MDLRMKGMRMYCWRENSEENKGFRLTSLQVYHLFVGWRGKVILYHDELVCHRATFSLCACRVKRVDNTTDSHTPGVLHERTSQESHSQLWRVALEQSSSTRVRTSIGPYHWPGLSESVVYCFIFCMTPHWEAGECLELLCLGIGWHLQDISTDSREARDPSGLRLGYLYLIQSLTSCWTCSADYLHG
jgi:hypothetical protein